MKYAPKRIDGLMAYVITERSWGRQNHRIEWCTNLTEAKRQHGWTRQMHTTITVRRATLDDLSPSSSVPGTPGEREEGA